MKQVKVLLVTVFLGVFLTSCASNQAGNSAKSEKQEISAPEEVVCPYDDWKYKGFGYELPVWVDSALSGNLKSSDTIVFIAKGINSDMCEQINQETISKSDELKNGYELTGSTWVRVADSGEYFSIKIYKKKEL